ncbi:hypothetical protein T06_765 [Trichinella sp. T6]|nr:hypothetical protein T06_765 [Trichinella sp. T6]
MGGGESGGGRECQAGIQFCTDGGNGGRVYNSLWVDEELAFL